MLTIEGGFSVTVQGDPKTWQDAYTFAMLMNVRMLAVDPYVTFDETNFQKITYIFVWQGFPFDWVSFGRVKEYIEKQVPKYFTKWSFKISVEFIDRG